MLYLYFVRAEYRYINWLNDFSDYALSLKQMVLLIGMFFFMKQMLLTPHSFGKRFLLSPLK